MVEKGRLKDETLKGVQIRDDRVNTQAWLGYRVLQRARDSKNKFLNRKIYR